MIILYNFCLKKSLLLYMARYYIIEHFEYLKPFVHVLDIFKNQLLSINNACFKTFNILFDKINIDDDKTNDENSNEYSRIKSLCKILFLFEFCLF